MNVLLTWKPSNEELSLIKECWPSEFDICRHTDLDQSALDKSLADVHVMAGHMRGASVDLVRHAPRLRLIHTLGHGVDAILEPGMRELLEQRGIQVARSNAAAITIAEFTIMNMIALSRRLIGMHTRLAHHGDWSSAVKADRAAGSLGGELYDSVLGIVGYGLIAKEVHSRARGLGMTVGAVVRNTAIADHGLDFLYPAGKIDEFVGRCDYVVLCAPLTPETHNLFDEHRIQAMKDGAYLLNPSRGALVDEGALYRALRSGKLSGAALDVWAAEEQGTPSTGYPSAYPLHEFNVIMTPHYAGATRESRGRALATVGRNLRRLLDGDELENVVDFQRGF